MKKIKDLLGLSDFVYMQVLLSDYIMYCEQYASNTQELQALMANSRHWKFFKQTRDQLEQQFLIEIQGYEHLHRNVLWQYYNDAIAHMGKYYARQIVKRARKMKIDNQIKTK